MLNAEDTEYVINKINTEGFVYYVTGYTDFREFKEKDPELYENFQKMAEPIEKFINLLQARARYHNLNEDYQSFGE
jgi:hypothetical protein